MRMPTLLPFGENLISNGLRLGVRLEVTQAVLNHISGSRCGIAGVYQRHDWAAEKRAALDSWGAHVSAVIEGGDRFQHRNVATHHLTLGTWQANSHKGKLRGCSTTEPLNPITRSDSRAAWADLSMKNDRALSFFCGLLELSLQPLRDARQSF
jgi:hypothetical protein